MKDEKSNSEAGEPSSDAIMAAIRKITESGAVINHPSVYYELPEFGLFHLSIPEAAELTVVDMWFSGEIDDIEEPSDFDGEPTDPRLRELLAGHVELFIRRLLDSVQSGLLKADISGRDYDDQLIAEHTYISYDALVEWLEYRGYNSSDIFSEWLDKQQDIASAVVEEIAFYKAATKAEMRSISSSRLEAMLAIELGTADRLEVSDLPTAYKAAILEIKQLKKELATQSAEHTARVDRPISARPRRTLLTIIAALCDYSAIKPNERGAAGQIAAMTDEIGAPVTAETIAGLLKEIPEALETRMK